MGEQATKGTDRGDCERPINLAQKKANKTSHKKNEQQEERRPRGKNRKKIENKEYQEEGSKDQERTITTITTTEA